AQRRDDRIEIESVDGAGREQSRAQLLDARGDEARKALVGSGHVFAEGEAAHVREAELREPVRKEGCPGEVPAALRCGGQERQAESLEPLALLGSERRRGCRRCATRAEPEE